MSASPFGHHGFALLALLMVSTIALLERFVQVVAPKLGVPIPVGLLILILVYLVYLGLVRRWFASCWIRAEGLPATALFLTGWLFLAMVFAWVYPLADSGRLGFYSDREEAIDVAVKALWNGQFPYACHAKPGVHGGCPETGNPIGPMPGAFLFSAPVVFLFGSAGWLSLLSLWVAYWGLSAYWQCSGKSFVQLAALLAAAPVLWAEILTGGDHLANTILVCVPLILLIQQPDRKYAKGLAIGLGCALSWRGLFWLLAVPVTIYFVRRHRWRELLVLGGYALAGFAFVTLPFLLWQPEGFSPWQAQQRYHLYERILPHASQIIPGLIAALGIYLGWRATSQAALFLACGWVLMLPILAGAVFNSLELGRPTLLFYGWYSIACLLFFSIPVFQNRPG